VDLLLIAGNGVARFRSSSRAIKGCCRRRRPEPAFPAAWRAHAEQPALHAMCAGRWVCRQVMATPSPHVWVARATARSHAGLIQGRRPQHRAKVQRSIRVQPLKANRRAAGACAKGHQFGVPERVLRVGVVGSPAQQRLCCPRATPAATGIYAPLSRAQPHSPLQSCPPSLRIGVVE